MEKNSFNNWSGSMAFEPEDVKHPESEEEIIELLSKAAKKNKKVRVVGAGHSSSPIVKNEDILISLKHFKGVEFPDLVKKRATVLSGMTVKEAGKDLFRHELAMPNTGDVDVQTLAGAIGTGTHGTGVDLQNLSSMLAGVRMITGKGEILEANIDDKELFRALKVSLGSCGIFLKMRLQLDSVYELQRKEWCITFEKFRELFEDLKENRNFDFYWYPRSDMVKIRVMNKKDKEMPKIPEGTLDFKNNGYSHNILPRSRHLKFDEMEYALPAEDGFTCFLEVRERIKKLWRKNVGWRVLFRTIKADDGFISPMYQRDSFTISLHHNAGLPFWNYI